MPAVLDLKTFIGAEDYDLSRLFYRELGWAVSELTDDLSEASLGEFSFFLQRYYDKTWCENTMMFMAVEDAAEWRAHIDKVLAAQRFGTARADGPSDQGYALVTHLWDPSGVLWHIAQSK